MSLLCVQQQLVTLITCSADVLPKAEKLELSAQEETWLENLRCSQGLKVSQDIAQWWRRSRLHTALPLTMRYLRKTNSDQYVEDYTRHHPCTTLFFAQEAKQFYDYLAQSEDLRLDPLLRLAEFEVALRDVKLLRNQNNPTDRYYRIGFPCNPYELIQNLLGNEPITLEDKRHYIVTVSTTVKDLWECEISESISPSVTPKFLI